MQGNAARAANAKLKEAGSAANCSSKLGSPVNISASMGHENQNSSTHVPTMGSIAEETDGDTGQDVAQHMARAEAAVREFAYGPFPESVVC